MHVRQCLQLQVGPDTYRQKRNFLDFARLESTRDESVGPVNICFPSEGGLSVMPGSLLLWRSGNGMPSRVR